MASGDEALVTVLQAPLAEARRIVEECNAAGVPVSLGRDDHCTKGCSPKLLVLARREDAPRFQAFMQQRFRALVEREGTMSAGAVVVGEVPDGTMPCPACGALVRDDEAECPDCGLAC